MNLSLKGLLAVGVILSAPSPAAARIWPILTMAGTPGFRPAAPKVSPAPRDRPATRAKLTLKPIFTTARAEQDPRVNIRAKAGWSDDEGFRLSPARVAFKRRF